MSDDVIDVAGLANFAGLHERTHDSLKMGEAKNAHGRSVERTGRSAICASRADRIK